jgi:hypothetical protein
MDNIIEPNNLFDFSKISLAHPVGIQGGAYFTKIEFNNKPLYIQTSKSLTKQGFVKTGKKYHCDLLFDKNSEELMNWFENLEVKCHKLIFEKKEIWFQGNLEETDIESAFNPLIRIYKSGKYYLLRTNVKNTKDDIPAVKIYDEKQAILGISDITNETEIISILEIQGIKFTSRNFQIEIEIKQIMVLNNNPIFENCLIKPNTKSLEITKNQKTIISNSNDLVVDKNILYSTTFPIINEKTNKSNSLETLTDLEEIESLNFLPIEEPIEELNKEIIEEPIEELNKEVIEEPIEESIEELNEEEREKPDKEPIEEPYEESVDIVFEDLDKDLDEDIQENNKLKEMNDIELNLEKNVETIKLKKPNQVYFKLYKEARNKAKLAKKNAILAYLEAKNIKKTYMIENINDSDSNSDSDFDAEIEEVSESELDNL